MTAVETPTVIGFSDHLDTLGYTADELVSLLYFDAAGGVHTAVMAPADALTAAAQLPADANCFYGVNPVGGPPRSNAGRGTEADVTRLAALVADLDLKPGGCPNLDVAHAIIAEISIILGTRPSTIVFSGNGIHPYWPVSDGRVANGDIANTRALVRRFGRLVALVAGHHNVRVDSVFDLPRVMRLPGSYNNKTTNGDGPKAVVAYAAPGGPLTMSEIHERLTEVGIDEHPDDATVNQDIVSPPTEWPWAQHTCTYVDKMIDGWSTDTPSARNPWFYSNLIRLNCAYREGCITQADYQRASGILVRRLTELVATTEPRRQLARFEISGAAMRAIGVAASKTNDQARRELGGWAGHTHADWFREISPGGVTSQNPGTVSTDDDDGTTVPTVPWPTLNATAMHGTTGKIVNLVAQHTEADPAAILVQLMAQFGAAVGPGPHFIAGNDRHQAIINPLIVGRTNSGAKGTSLGVVDAIRRQALPWFDEFVTSGLSSAEGLIERVRDSSGDPESKDYDSGVDDKRLMVIEPEYKSVLVRQKRDGNTLSATLRDAFDCRTLRTLTRQHNKLTATQPHIVIIGHVTPKEFRATLDDNDLAGGSVNRLLICLSRRSRLHSRFGNIPPKILSKAADLFDNAYKLAVQRGKVEFTEEFWAAWESAYRNLNRDRPDTRATDATARAVTIVLRLSLIYALVDGAEDIDADHLNAALALWAYCEDGARWLFSTYENEIQTENTGGLAEFIRTGGPDGRTRTEISVDHFKRNTRAAEITSQLMQLVHDGVVIEIKDETGARPITRYLHRSLRTNELTNYAGQDPGANSYTTNLRTQTPEETGDGSSEFVNERSGETLAEQHTSLNSLFRTRERETDTNSQAPGGPTANTPGMTDRVQQIIAKRNGRHPEPICDDCGKPLMAPLSVTRGRCEACALSMRVAP
jgi:hypothetical protein